MPPTISQLGLKFRPDILWLVNMGFLMWAKILVHNFYLFITIYMLLQKAIFILATVGYYFHVITTKYVCYSSLQISAVDAILTN